MWTLSPSVGWGSKYAALGHRVEPMCGNIDCSSPRRWLSRARISKNVSQLLKYIDGPEMQFCDLRPFIGPRTIDGNVPHEPRRGLTVRYLGDSEKRKGVTRLDFAIPVRSDVFAHCQRKSPGIGLTATPADHPKFKLTIPSTVTSNRVVAR